METNKPQLLKPAMNYGAITGLVMVVYSLILYFTGLYLMSFKAVIDIVILSACIFISQKVYRDKELGGIMNYQQALGFGVLVGVFAAIILGFFSFIEIKFIDPTIIDKQLELVQQKYLESGISEEQVEKMMVMAKKWSTPGIMFAGAIFSYAFYAFIITLITSIFSRKEGNPFQQSNTAE